MSKTTKTIELTLSITYTYDENNYLIKHNGEEFVKMIAEDLAVNPNLNTVECGVSLIEVKKIKSE